MVARTECLLVACVALLLVSCNTGNSEADTEHCSQGASCTTTSSAATTTTVPVPNIHDRNVAVNDLRFTLPAELTYGRKGGTSTGELMEGFYANFPLATSCANGCGSSFGSLPANSVVVGLGMLSGFPTPPSDLPNTSIAGRTASYAVSRPGICGSDETITVRLPHGTLGEYLVRACVSGPDLSVGERVVQALVASASFSGS
jgi:hypothetical protein